MTERVYVTVKGLHAGAAGEGVADEDKIEIINVGTYRNINGKEYIKYNEMYDDGERYTTLIKLTNKDVELTKRGAVTTHMSFIEGEKTRNLYETPYGSIYMGIYSKRIDIRHEDDMIFVTIDYSVEVNYQLISESRVEIKVQNHAPELL